MPSGAVRLHRRAHRRAVRQRTVGAVASVSGAAEPRATRRRPGRLTGAAAIYARSGAMTVWRSALAGGLMIAAGVGCGAASPTAGNPGSIATATGPAGPTGGSTATDA